MLLVCTQGDVLQELPSLVLHVDHFIYLFIFLVKQSRGVNQYVEGKFPHAKQLVLTSLNFKGTSQKRKI